MGHVGTFSHAILRVLSRLWHNIYLWLNFVFVSHTSHKMLQEFRSGMSNCDLNFKLWIIDVSICLLLNNYINLWNFLHTDFFGNVWHVHGFFRKQSTLNWKIVIGCERLSSTYYEWFENHDWFCHLNLRPIIEPEKTERLTIRVVKP